MEILLPDTPETIKRRRAMLLGLQSLFDAEQSLIALCIWERDFADAASAFIGVHTYARSICEHFARQEMRRELHAALLDALFQSEDKLPPDPSAAMRRLAPHALLPPPGQAPAAVPSTSALAPSAAPQQPAALRPPTPPAPALNITLCLLLRALRSALAELDPAAPGNCALGMESALHALRLPAETALALPRFLQLTELPVFASAISVKQAGGLVNLLYVWMAENLGPEQADKLLARVISQVEQDPQAKGFGVRQLL